MTDEIGRREFIKRGTVAGVVATTGLSAATVARAATLPVASSSAVGSDAATVSAPHPARPHGGRRGAWRLAPPS